MRTAKRSQYLSILIGCGLLAGILSGQDEWYNHPELEWQSFETEHFLIHFHQGTERSAREAAAVAEKVYGPITRIYNYEPPAKTHLIIKDVDDVSNGIAYFFDNKIEIWSRPLDFDLRGSHRWMQGVITHEFVHIIQLGTAMKFSRRIPGMYFQVIGYEDEKREDVLYGYPNVLASYPVPGVNIPPWFAEGVAQFMYPGANYDYWDSHRDMILRDRVLNNKLLSFAAMNSFGKRGTGNESVYNHGFAFVQYLAERYSVQTLEDISRSMASPVSVSISRAMAQVTGTSGLQLYREWKAELESYYHEAMTNVRSHEVSGEMIIQDGTTNIHPVWHPSERTFAFLSNLKSDFFGQTDLYIYDMDSRKMKRIATAVVSAPCWSADGGLLYYAGRSKPGRTGARWLDLFAYDVDRGKKERLTHGERVTSPVLVGEGESIAYLTVKDGSSNIRVLNLATKEITSITDFSAGEYIHSLTYDPIDSALIFDITLNHGRQIHKLRLKDGEVSPHVQITSHFPDGGDLRDPIQTDRGLLLSADVTGVFNLYWLQADSVRGYVTNVTGGAFMPSVNSRGEVLFSIYQDGGYKIAYLPGLVPLDEGLVGIPTSVRRERPESSKEGPDTQLIATPYKEEFSRPFLLPRIMMDYGTVKPGVYFYANEVLDRLFVFGGASINRLMDRDLFLSFEFRKFRPTIYTQIYAVRRHVSRDFAYYDYSGTNDLRFDLIEGVVGGRMPLGFNRIWVETILSQYREHIYQRLADQSGGFSFPYYKGVTVAARWQYSARRPEYAGNMFPQKGFEVEMELRGEANDLASDFTISRKYSTPVTVYDENNTLRVRLNLKTYATLHRKTRLTAAYETTLGWLSNTEVDTFFYFFGGGPPGLRGYTYYDSTLQGTNLMVHTLTLRVPVFLERNIPFLHLILQNVSVGVVLQLGDGFNGSWSRHRYTSSAGMELRVQGFNFYVFPFALSYEIHRPVGSDFERYRHYVSLLFDF